MWPFKRKPVVTVSPEVQSYDEARSKLKKLCQNLEIGSAPTPTDSEILVVYSNVKNRMQSNCDSVAQGLFTSIADICAHRPHLASDILPDALQPLYHLGIEDLEGIKKYIRWLVDFDEPYHGRPTPSGYRYLRELTEQDQVIIDAFRSMYSKEKNDWREEDEDVPTVPSILTGERDGGGQPGARAESK
jgi:hypothetical protein